MIGREAYQNPYILAEIEKHIFKNESVPTRDEIALKMVDYARAQYEMYQTPVKSVTRHILGLYQGLPRSKRWRRTLSEAHKHPEDYFDIIQDALNNMHSKKTETCIAAWSLVIINYIISGLWEDSNIVFTFLIHLAVGSKSGFTQIWIGNV